MHVSLQSAVLHVCLKCDFLLQLSHLSPVERQQIVGCLVKPWILMKEITDLIIVPMHHSMRLHPPLQVMQRYCAFSFIWQVFCCIWEKLSSWITSDWFQWFRWFFLATPRHDGLPSPPPYEEAVNRARALGKPPRVPNSGDGAHLKPQASSSNSTPRDSIGSSSRGRSSTSSSPLDSRHRHRARSLEHMLAEESLERGRRRSRGGSSQGSANSIPPVAPPRSSSIEVMEKLMGKRNSPNGKCCQMVP